MNFSFLPKYLPYFNYGAVVTILISICVIFLGTILGVVLAFGQRSKFKPLVWLANLYVWIFRGTPMMVPKGQLEAAYSLGIRPKNAMRYVILPQAVKNILPALGNEFITIIKDSSLLSAIGVMELWNGATTVSTTTYLPLTPLLFAAFYYLIMTSILTVALKSFEKHMGQGDKK
ncbi:TPA: amino acid ABC transporter permease [Streptococcus pneumoniae]|nr:amino acid ABC transporter permease [Streptococcus pneumoniae]VRA86518.1 amino acid ABC transporter permease [Streptococcus pneumoniae]